jgi:hypothetical protein
VRRHGVAVSLRAAISFSELVFSVGIGGSVSVCTGPCIQCAIGGCIQCGCIQWLYSVCMGWPASLSCRGAEGAPSEGSGRPPPALTTDPGRPTGRRFRYQEKSAKDGMRRSVRGGGPSLLARSASRADRPRVGS